MSDIDTNVEFEFECKMSDHLRAVALKVFREAYVKEFYADEHAQFTKDLQVLMLTFEVPEQHLDS